MSRGRSSLWLYNYVLCFFVFVFVFFLLRLVLSVFCVYTYISCWYMIGAKFRTISKKYRLACMKAITPAECYERMVSKWASDEETSRVKWRGGNRRWKWKLREKNDRENMRGREREGKTTGTWGCGGIEGRKRVRRVLHVLVLCVAAASWRVSGGLGVGQRVRVGQWLSAPETMAQLSSVCQHHTRLLGQRIMLCMQPLSWLSLLLFVWDTLCVGTPQKMTELHLFVTHVY